MFLGTYAPRLDEKGRIILPAKFAESLADGVVITRGQERCLYVYARDEFDPYAPYGASGVRLLDGDTAYYGLDYLVAKGGHRCLCDRLLNQAIPPGSAQRIALWFPAPATGTSTVTIDVADEFRITGVPVS